jgi:two-component system chemotaxis response regulator CheB
MRKYLMEILNQDPRLEVVDTARDGEEAVSKALALRPDVVTLDLNMPKMDGLTALQLIMERAPCPVVVISSLTQRGALTTFEALALGAVDYVAKPEGTVSLGIKRLAEEIRAKVKAAAVANRAILRERRSRAETPPPPKAKHAADTMDKLVIIGVSTGGPRVLEEILPNLPADLPAAVIVVQHMPENFTAAFARRMDNICPLTVKEAEHGELLTAGKIVVAKGGHHLKVDRVLGTGALRVRLSRDTGGGLYVPSVNVTLASARRCLEARRIVGVLLTGMGDDGADEMVALRREGGFTIAESAETAVVWGMPGEAWRRGGAEVLAPAYEIAKLIDQAVRRPV